MRFIIKLFQCFFCWRIKPDSEKEIASADVIISQSFGSREPYYGFGISNEKLAILVWRIHLKYRIPLILQWEIADCIPDLPKAYVVEKHRIEGEYLDTYECIYQQRVFCQTKGWQKAIMIAHPDHYWRCMMVAKKLGFKVIAIDTSSVPYDSLSSQPWTRSAIRFIPREIVARLIYLFTNKV